MTRKEAIKELKEYEDGLDLECATPFDKAILYAIQALSQEPNRDIEEIAEVIKSDVDTETKCKMISNILTAKPHYFEKQEPCDDAISREAVIEATHHCGDLQEVREVVQQLPSVNPQPICEEREKGECPYYAG